MPCFNAQATVDEAIDSLLQGTWQDIELVAVDDGSADDTLGRLKAWAGRDQRVRLVGIEHGGLVDALNAGWRQAGGTLIARMDADDVALPTRLAKQVALLEARPDLAAVGSLVESFPPESARTGFQRYLDWLNGLIEEQAIAREIFVESPLPHPTVVIRRSWLERMGGYEDHGWPEDYDLCLRMHLAGARFAKVPEVLLRWREHPDRATRTDSRYSVENFLRAKAHYLALGPLADADGVIVWGAGQMGRRLSKHLLRAEVPIDCFLDVDPSKIGRRTRDRPVLPPEALMERWRALVRPKLLAVVGSHKARPEIRAYLVDHGLVEGVDWWAAA
jgi:glycosyltransferase involved in cell wall biosynthesis